MVYAESKDTSVLVGITGGNLYLSAASTSQAFQIPGDGKFQSSSAGLDPLTIIDATGTGKGWHVTVQASQVREVLPDGSVGKITLPYHSLTLNNHPGIIGAGGASNFPSAAYGVWAIDDPCGPVTIASARENEGMGRWVLNFPEDCLKLDINPNIDVTDSENYSGKPVPFQTTITWSITAGP